MTAISPTDGTEDLFLPSYQYADSTADQIMGKDDFMMLLVAQLRNQDPLNPLDNADFGTQLAQFSSLEQLQEMNNMLAANLDASLFLSLSITNSLATTLVGKEVSAYGDTVTLADGEPMDLHFKLDADATSVEIKIYDESSTLVRTIDAGALAEGQQAVSFDGKGDGGQDLTDGEYTFSVEAKAADDTTVSATPYLTGIVTAVRYQDGDVVLLLGEQEVSISRIFEVRDPAAS